MKLSEQVKTLPPGSIISVAESSMSVVRYHARGCRDINTRINLATGKRDVKLGKFYIKPK